MVRSIASGAILCVLWGAFATVLAPQAHAQDTLLADIYGQGVHAYYAGDYQKAHELLTTTIDQGFEDPRAFYFRGVVYQKLGRPEEAQEDFKQGAVLEVTNDEQVIDVGRAMQRIQGSVRLEIEQQRRLARLKVRDLQERRRRARYEQLKESEERALRQETNDPVPVPTPKAPADPNDPFGGAAPPSEDGADPDGADPDGAAPAVPDENEPFGTPPATTPPADDDAPADDPFATPPPTTTPADDAAAGTDPPAVSPDTTAAPGSFDSLFRAVTKALPGQAEEDAMPMEGGANPFGGLLSGEGDGEGGVSPFGADPDAPAPANPFGNDGADPDSPAPANPFGNDGADPDAPAPANPFGNDGADPDSPAPANPFGNDDADPDSPAPANPFGNDDADPDSPVPANPFGGEPDSEPGENPFD